MSSWWRDPRAVTPSRWKLLPPIADHPGRRLRALILLNLALAVWYFGWLLQPERVGDPLVYGALIAAELFNLAQASGFWWTVARDRTRPREPVPRAWERSRVDVDVLIPVCGEPVGVVEPTVVAATRMRGASVRVALLDDGDSDEMAALAARHGVRYIRRREHSGAKAGNVNHALARTWAPFVALFDCDHVPAPGFLAATLGHLVDERVAFVQTPQFYANAHHGAIASGAWGQQALFFGAICRGKDRLGATFCCGTNFLFRREALEEMGGFPEESVTEDFELSIKLHERGWKSVYVPEVLVRGLGPEDMGAYVSQQKRWARGCLSALPRALRSRLAWRQRVQYLLSSMYFLSGWTLLVYMSLPVVQILGGAQPLASATADQLLVHFGPYFSCAILTVAVAGGGAYTFRAFALAAATFWVHIWATLRALLRLRGRFVVTPKGRPRSRQPGAIVPSLLCVAVLLGVATYGMLTDRSPGTLNNVAFAGVHVSVLLAGALPALRRPSREGGGVGLSGHGPADRVARQERPATGAPPAPTEELVRHP